jgi:hypothetical protein
VIFTIGSVTGSPGATTLAVGLAASWPVAEPRGVLEADADGGRLGAQLGVHVEPGILELAVSARDRTLDERDLERCSASMGEWRMIPGPPSAEQAASALISSESIAAALTSGTWFVDAGRLSTRSPTVRLAAASTLTIVVTRGDLAHLQLVPHRIDALAAAGCTPSIVVVEPTDWPTSEIAAFVGADVVGTLPFVGGQHSWSSLWYRAWRPWWSAVQCLGAALARSAGLGHG